MADAITIDDVDAGFFEAEAATARTKSAVTKSSRKKSSSLSIFSLTRDLWKVDRSLKQLVGLYHSLDLRDVPGMTCQHLEKRLSSLAISLEQCVDLCKSHGLDNRTLTAGALRSIDLKEEELKDIWVALSSSTDCELDEALALARSEQSSSWDSLWR